jgi:hypothetical protein
LKARSVSEIVFTGIVPATIGLSATAGGATPDRAPSNPALGTPSLIGGSRQNQPNGVLLPLSSLAVGMLVVAGPGWAAERGWWA